MDRLYAFGAEGYKPLKGKRIGIILTYGDADPFTSGAVNALRSFQDAFAYVGAPIKGMVYGTRGQARRGPGEREPHEGGLRSRPEARRLNEAPGRKPPARDRIEQVGIDVSSFGNMFGHSRAQ